MRKISVGLLGICFFCCCGFLSAKKMPGKSVMPSRCTHDVWEKRLAIPFALALGVALANVKYQDECFIIEECAGAPLSAFRIASYYAKMFVPLGVVLGLYYIACRWLLHEPRALPGVQLRANALASISEFGNSY